MIEFELTDDHKAIQQTVRDFATQEVAPRIKELDEKQTFDRSINTSFTVILVLACLLAFGGTVTTLFNWALLIGIIIGTYSSIYVAAAIVVIWKDLRTGRKLQVVPAIKPAPPPPAAARKKKSGRR